MELKNGMIVHCDTREKAYKFLKECHKQGWEWGSGDKILDSEGYIKFNPWLFKKNTVYYLKNGKITFGHVWYVPENELTLFDELEVNDKKCKVYTKPKFIHNDVAKVIINEPCVIVFLDGGEKGISKCCPDDKFDEELGYRIAYQRAKIKQLKKDIDSRVEYLEFITR